MEGLKYYKEFLVFCFDCNVSFITNDRRHDMTYCPKCKENAVDIEKEYGRIIGNVRVLGEVNNDKKN